MNNASGSFEDDDKIELKIAINSIQETAYVERLPNPNNVFININDVRPYDLDNLYPNKIKSMAQRSQSTISAIKTLSRFSHGQGFVDESVNKITINNIGQTLFDILKHSTSEKSMFNGFALHFNYNIFGEIIEIQEIPFETLRWKYDYSKLVFCIDWRYGGFQKTKNRIEYFPFNPDNVINEINKVGGLDNYVGQVLYWIPKLKEIYTLCRFDHCLDDTQFEHESGLYKLRNIQNDYSAGHIFFYPAQIGDELEKMGLINDIKKSRGSGNAGKTKGVPLNPSTLQALGNRKMIEEIPRTGIDKMFSKQNEETRFNIYAAFNQPPILNGISKEGMFNQESFIDAFDFYNSITESDRQEIEKVFNKFLSYSIFGIENIEIKPLEFLNIRKPKQSIDI